MRKALCIGINYYENNNHLRGCVDDAIEMSNALEFNYDESRNFQTACLVAYDKETAISNEELADRIDWLFEGEPDIALLYFSGHGALVGKEGYLCPSNFCGKNTGVAMSDIIQAAESSGAKNKIIILDCCHAGAAGSAFFANQISVLPDDTVIFAGCSQNGYSQENQYGGIFTNLFIEALMDAGSNILGEVTPGSIYAYIDKSLGAFEQRPVFKANVKNFICLRKNKAPISFRDLRKLTEYFENPFDNYPLDPSYEKEKYELPEDADKTRNLEHEEIFKVLRKYHSLNLLVPVGEEYMYYAALNSKACRLTALGRHYWSLVYKKII